MKQKILLRENPHVLIIEDHELMRKAQTMVVQFSLPKAVVHTPSSIKEVTQLLDTKEYDAILLDNNLRHFPDGATCKGIDLIPLIREKSPKAKIIFTSMDNGVGAMLLKQHKVDASVSKENLADVLCG